MPRQGKPSLRFASAWFDITPNLEPGLTSYYGAVTEVCGPLKTTVNLLDDGECRVCIISCDTSDMADNVGSLFRRVVGDALAIPQNHVVIFSSHNHSDFNLAVNPRWSFKGSTGCSMDVELLPVGEAYLNKLCDIARELTERLQPVTVCWTVGHEDRITYNRKGRRADGSTLMLEEDRIREGIDYCGDIDTQAPVIVFKNAADVPIAAWVQFTGHPVTSFRPESPIVFGDWPHVACNYLARHFSADESMPVSFFQGCAGDVSSKEMFRGGVKRAFEFGEMLGKSYVDSLTHLRPSTRDGLDFTHATVNLPLAPLPSEPELIEELAEIDNFIRRAKDGDESAVSCIGLNFPYDLSPMYRAGLVEQVRPWTEWALEQHWIGNAENVPKTITMDLWVLRVGDVGMVGIPCEPFQGIGRQIRDGSQMGLTIACGYVNYAMGYITDGPNTGDREYMSSSYRYTALNRDQSEPRPPFAKPGGDVIAEVAVRLLNEMAKG